MSDATLYGIKNCDTMKKAFNWLEQNKIIYHFHDYKKHAPNIDVLKHAIKQHGWENVINRRGTTWRKIPQEIQTTMTPDIAIKIALENPSILKRPLLINKGESYLGFSADIYATIFE